MTGRKPVRVAPVDRETDRPPLYTPEWLATQMGTHGPGTRVLLGAFAHLYIPTSFLDIGCGDGFMVKVAAQLGVPSIGVDIAPVEEAQRDYQILKRDLREPLDLGRQFDLVWSSEVAEHIPLEHGDDFASSIARHVGNWLVFTAAVYGQGGDGHIACQDPVFWRSRFEARGLTYLPGQTERLRETWRWSAGDCIWYPNNLMVFKRLVV